MVKNIVLRIFWYYFSCGAWNNMCNVFWVHQAAISSIGVLCTTDAIVFVQWFWDQNLGKITMYLFHFYNHINLSVHSQRIFPNKHNENIMQQGPELQCRELTFYLLVHLPRDCSEFWELVGVKQVKC